jgi:hypothetical protein
LQKKKPGKSRLFCYARKIITLETNTMNTLIAIAHICGALIVLIGLGFVALLISSWEIERNRKNEIENLTLHLGISIDDLEKEEFSSKIIQFSAERFSNELLRNRLSDLCGVIRTAWNWLGLLLQAGTILGVVWTTFTDGYENAVYAWLVVAIWIYFWGMSIVFSLLCKLLTGRYPGQAKTARNSMSEFLRLHTSTA